MFLISLRAGQKEINMAENIDLNNYKESVIRAADAYNKKEYENALEKFLALVELNPENEKVHETLAYIYIKLSDLKKADHHYKILLSLMKKKDPNFKIPLTLDEVIKELEHPKELEKRFFQIMKSEDVQSGVSGTRTSIQLSMHLMARGHYDKAEKVLSAYKSKHMKNS